MKTPPSLLVRTGSVILALMACLAFATAAESEEAITDKQVIELVKTSVSAMKDDAAGTITKVNKGEHPFRNKDNAALYVFVYDEQLNMVAHPKADLVGKNFKGKPDVKGVKFRDQILDTALTKGAGWVDYAYQKPGEKGIFDKTTYCELAVGSDGKKYVVCAGMYKK